MLVNLDFAYINKTLNNCKDNDKKVKCKYFTVFFNLFCIYTLYFFSTGTFSAFFHLSKEG